MSFRSKKRTTEPVSTETTEQQMDIAQCLNDIRMAVVAAAIFLDENANETHRDRAHALIMEAADQFGIDWK